MVDGSFEKTRRMAQSCWRKDLKCVLECSRSKRSESPQRGGPNPRLLELALELVRWSTDERVFDLVSVHLATHDICPTAGSVQDGVTLVQLFMPLHGVLLQVALKLDLTKR